MRVTIDLSAAVHRHAGLGRYAQELTTALVAEGLADYQTIYYAKGGERPDPPLDALPARPIRLGAKPWRLSVMLAYAARVPMDRWLPETDVLHATEHLLPYVRSAATVLTVHDLIFKFFPEYHLWQNRWYLGTMLPRFACRADAIIAVSEHTKRDVMKLLKVPEQKITVVPEGVNPAFRPLTDAADLARVRARYALPERYLLYLGTIEPRKNLVTLLNAYHALLSRQPEIDLVLAGKNGWLYQPVYGRVRELGLEQRVHFTGWVDEGDAPALISGAAAFVYPSLYEGFGLPPLEALACGVPVIASNASSLPEVVADAGLLVAPNDPASLAEAMERVLADPELAADLRTRGPRQAALFTWQRAARRTFDIYKSVAVRRAARRLGV